MYSIVTDTKINHRKLPEVAGTRMCIPKSIIFIIFFPFLNFFFLFVSKKSLMLVNHRMNLVFIIGKIITKKSNPCMGNVD